MISIAVFTIIIQNQGQYPCAIANQFAVPFQVLLLLDLIDQKPKTQSAKTW